MASVILAMRTIYCTSCTRMMSAPRVIPTETVAAVPSTRWSGGRSNVKPMKDLRDVPNKTGYPNARISSKRRMSSRLWLTVFPNPIPGSRMMRSDSIPACSDPSLLGQSDGGHQLALNVLDQILIFRTDIGIAQLLADFNCGRVAAVVH